MTQRNRRRVLPGLVTSLCVLGSAISPPVHAQDAPAADPPPAAPATPAAAPEPDTPDTPASWADMLGQTDADSLWHACHDGATFYPSRLTQAIRVRQQDDAMTSAILAAYLLARQPTDPYPAIRHQLDSPDPADVQMALFMVLSLDDRRFLHQISRLRDDRRRLMSSPLAPPTVKPTVGWAARNIRAAILQGEAGLLQKQTDATAPDWMKALRDLPYTLAEDDIVVPPHIALMVEELCHAFRRDYPTYRFTITSGTRSARRQAGALLYKLRRGEDLTALYKRDDLATEITTAFQKALDAGHTTVVPVDTDDQPQDEPDAPETAAVMAALTTVIQDQIDRGDFLSQHLRESAVDLRSKDMTPAQQAHFLQLVRQDARFHIIQEDTPPHFHLHIDTPTPKAE